MNKKKILEDAWFLREPIDFEHKQYVLLDWIQWVQSNFDEFKLWPLMSEIDVKVKIVNSFLNSNKNIIEKIKIIEGIDWEEKKPIYNLPPDSEEITELNKIAGWARKKLETLKEEGIELVKDISKDIRIEHIGIISNSPAQEGYLVLIVDGIEEINIYKYNVSKVLDPKTKKRKTFLKKEETLKITEEEILKIDFHEYKEKYKNLNFLKVEINKKYPLSKTILPILREKIREVVFRDLRDYRLFY